MRRHARRGRSGGGQQAGQRGLAPHGDMAGLQEHVADLHARTQVEEAWRTALLMGSAGREAECHAMSDKGSADLSARPRGPTQAQHPTKRLKSNTRQETLLVKTRDINPTSHKNVMPVKVNPYGKSLGPQSARASHSQHPPQACTASLTLWMG